MANRKRNNRKKVKKKKSLRRKFFKIVFSMLTIYFISLIGFFAYAYFQDTSQIDGNEKISILDKVVDKVASLPERTNILLACTDEESNRTDAIMLVSYNSINKKISLVSIPRDLKVSIPNYMWSVMVENFPELSGVSRSPHKINAISNYGGDMGMVFLKQYLEDLLEIEIDFYARFDFEGFRYIIDSVGGIEFDVPQTMYYSDPTQDLLINLKPGFQLLDGDKSEQLVRFRSYPQGDLQRIAVQQDFMKAFFSKITSLSSILTNFKAYYTTVAEYLETNITISDCLKYIKEIGEIDIYNIDNYTLPCYIDGVSYVSLEEDEIEEFVYQIFKKPTVLPEDIVYESSYYKSIMVLNGTYTSGLAGKVKQILEDNGYIVKTIGDSSESKSKETKIYVSTEGQGTDLQQFFTNSKILVNPIKVAEFGYDIVIIIGIEDEIKEQVSNS